MLSRFMLVTDRRLMKPSFEEALHAALEGGARLVQLREKDLTVEELKVLAQAAQRLCESFDASLLVNTEVEVARAIGARGVHWPERCLGNQIDYSKGFVNGVSVHSVEAAQSAQKVGADYVVFGAIFPTSSHPGAPVAGLEALREVTAAVSVPVYAIGGIDSERTANMCFQSGAHGIAVRSNAWEAPDVKQRVSHLRRWTGE
ncbi:MAG TPA: thiamine phosphate synthase [Abditibacteriaceae bacterium]|jgi:thiamine-phosphate pyrophosphorylase|nr:thiamine phosphate synthase [Abditibacteriaceae bacterium]